MRCLDQREAELRRLQEEETRANCPDEYNLLSATASQDNVESVEALKNTSAELVNTQNDPEHQQQITLRTADMELNDRESVNSAGENNASNLQASKGPTSYQN